jgi:hypothetical protein
MNKKVKYRLVYHYETEQAEFDDLTVMLKFLNDIYGWKPDEILEDEDFAIDKIQKGLEEENYFEFCDCDYVEYANQPFAQKCEHDLSFEIF